MARTTKAASTKAAVLETETDVTESAEPTTKQIISDGIVRVVEATGVDVQKNRYKAMRAIAFQAFSEAIESGDFEALVERAIQNADSLPAGWGLERTVAEEKAAAKAAPAKKAAAAKPATKAPAKRTTKAAATTEAKPARKRPTR